MDGLAHRCVLVKLRGVALPVRFRIEPFETLHQLPDKHTPQGFGEALVGFAQSEQPTIPDSVPSPGQLQCKLDFAGSRGCQVQRAGEGNCTSIRIRDGAIGVWRREIRMIEDVEELHSDLSLEIF
jgi:hypothetical protein